MPFVHFDVATCCGSQFVEMIFLPQVALWTLGQLVESTGSVVEPYSKYPNLLDVLLNFLKTEQSISIRREAS